MNVTYRRGKISSQLVIRVIPFRRTGKQGGLMVSMLDSGVSGPGSSPGQGHSVVLLDNYTLAHSHNASLHPGVEMGTDKLSQKSNKL